MNGKNLLVGLTRSTRKIALTGTILLLASCSSQTATQYLNPFYEPPAPEALLGTPNDHALNGTNENAGSARKALETMASYQRAKTPEPYNPVRRAAVIRLMWVPDHLNQQGDLIPDHYYYLKVKNDEWALQDAFENEEQLNGKGQRGSVTGNLPFVRK